MQWITRITPIFMLAIVVGCADTEQSDATDVTDTAGSSVGSNVVLPPASRLDSQSRETLKRIHDSATELHVVPTCAEAGSRWQRKVDSLKRVAPDRERDLILEEWQLVDGTPPSIDRASLDSATIYPSEAIARGIEGTVKIRVIVGKAADIQKYDVLCSDHGLLTEAAIDAVLAARYTGGVINNRRVRAYLTVPVEFRLEN